MKKSLSKVVSAIGASVLLLSGCAQTPDVTATSDVRVTPTVTETATAEASPTITTGFKACVVSEEGGAEGTGFGALAEAGLEQSAAELEIQTDFAQADAPGEYATSIQRMIDARCELIAAAGLELGTATEAAARQNAEINFATIDYAPRERTDNVKPVLFNTAQSSFLAGYLAASMSSSGKVGIFGAGRLPNVTIYMDGFSQGVAHHNQAKGTSVQLLGWSHEAQSGEFLTGDAPFTDAAGARALADSLVSQGADVIMPVAGPAGVGALEAAQAANGISVIWTDTDGCETLSAYCPVILSSVVKGVDQAVVDLAGQAEAGEFNSDTWVGTLANGGTSLAPLHDFETRVPDATKTELEQLKQAIIDGNITINSAAQPR